MQQIKLDTFDPSYASSDPIDLSEGEVWFKTIYGDILRGHCFKDATAPDMNIYWFESGYSDYAMVEVTEFHPVTVDL